MGSFPLKWAAVGNWLRSLGFNSIGSLRKRHRDDATKRLEPIIYYVSGVTRNSDESKNGVRPGVEYNIVLILMQDVDEKDAPLTRKQELCS
jgi:hypothetical protein